MKPGMRRATASMITRVADLSTVEDVVADADLLDRQSGREVVDHALVDALVAAAREDQPGLLAEALGIGLA